MMLQKKTKKNILQISDHPYRILTIVGSESWKLNSIFILKNHQTGIDKSHLYTKDPYEAKQQFLINKLIFN